MRASALIDFDVTGKLWFWQILTPRYHAHGFQHTYEAACDAAYAAVRTEEADPDVVVAYSHTFLAYTELRRTELDPCVERDGLAVMEEALAHYCEGRDWQKLRPSEMASVALEALRHGAAGG